MANRDQNSMDPLGNVVQEALATVLDGRLRALEAQISQKVSTTEAGLNELRIGHLRSEMNGRNSSFPSFSGRPSENFQEWAKRLEKQMLLKGLKIEDDALRLIFLEFHLEGDALVKFENLANSPNPPGTYEQFKQALLSAFPVIQDILLHRQMLRDRKQKRTETVMAYHNELEKLGRLAYPDFDLAIRENLITPVFREGLLPDIKNVIKFKQYPDFISLVTEAVFIERQILRDEATVPCIPSYPTFVREPILAVQHEDPLKSQVDQLSQKFDKILDELRNHGKNGNQKRSDHGVTCYKCGKKGHFASTCKKASEPPSSTSCSVCNGEGHVASACKAKCRFCRKTGHKHKNCPTVECRKCKQKGHLEKFCPQKHGQNHNNGSSIDLLDSDDPGMTTSNHFSATGLVMSLTIDLELFNDEMENRAWPKSCPPTPDPKEPEPMSEGELTDEAPGKEAEHKPVLRPGYKIPKLGDRDTNRAKQTERATVFQRIGCNGNQRYCRCTRCRRARTARRRERRNRARNLTGQGNFLAGPGNPQQGRRQDGPRFFFYRGNGHNENRGQNKRVRGNRPNWGRHPF